MAEPSVVCAQAEPPASTGEPGSSGSHKPSQVETGGSAGEQTLELELPAVLVTGLASSGARNETKRFGRFLVVGAFSFVVDTGSLVTFVQLFGFDRRLAKALAFALAVLSSFV